MTPPSQAFDEGPDATPSPARMYDYYLSGYHNVPADRAAAEQAIAFAPDIPKIAQANPAFLRRAVTYMIMQGVTQFLDLGSGIPTIGNVHDVAREAYADARVVYVDIDPVAVTHSAALLKDVPGATVIQADARRPEQILGHPEVRRLLDFDQPVGALLIAFLHFVTGDAEAEHLARGLRDALAPGSYVAVSHGSSDIAQTFPRAMVEGMEDVYKRSTNAVKMRSRAQIAALFEGLDLVEPGVVYTPEWHPEGPDDIFLNEPARAFCLAGVGRKS